ncbi:hypothetical protein QOZ84_09815 [Romboutsia sedimentorum]|uniref:Uncharacterized protein n=1 Tax=Romboutsia sedimentorum TaxID=1368474 RepID=A0ABT7EAA0_9FIRM|nr:hypothetical protein [Romboutsia sedimentorum]MDK2563846.1 hypothetical protein [Romboutsia sedimentorum]
MFIVIISLFIFALIYFLSMVCIHFSYITNLNLQFGSDVNDFYCDDTVDGIYGYVNYVIKNCAINLYKFSKLFK